ncbi:NADH pyrophosphatase [Steccherinum ochraceum]|uniref:NAD(+) diphosphatase n=1 Tax=Steccherinum ochraceum TaxID=92696 RepID=A0A4R0RS89_9APHY|nr:NADH pyrophosphatase [Steccherinum ochraceum]
MDRPGGQSDEVYPPFLSGSSGTTAPFVSGVPVGSISDMQFLLVPHGSPRPLFRFKLARIETNSRGHARFVSRMSSGSGDNTAAHVNFFAGSPLNRLAWLRTSHQFLNGVASSPATRWVLFQHGNLLMKSQSGGPDSGQAKSFSMARLTTEDVRNVLGPEPYFAQGKNAGESVQDASGALETARLHGPPVVFLGLQEPGGVHGLGAGNILPSSEFSKKSDTTTIADRIHGEPVFSLDVSGLTKDAVDSLVSNTDLVKKGGTLEFIDGRTAMGHLDQIDSGIFAVARSMVDWNSRIKFCASCGSSVYSQWGGWKRSCSSLLPWADNAGKEPCPTTTGLHNITFPRSDPVVIAVVISEDDEKILLGRNARWPPKFYSALAGFSEPGEALEDTFIRELWEEAAVKVRSLQFHSSQPWPFPANIMSGFYAIADSNEPVRTDLDNELEDAKWYTRSEVLSVLDGQNAEAAFKVPPRNALAGVLISDWAHGRITVGGEASKLSSRRARSLALLSVDDFVE